MHTDRCILQANAPVSFFCHESLEKNVAFLRGLDSLREDLAGVLGCQQEQEKGKVSFFFEISCGYLPEQYCRSVKDNEIHFTASDLWGILWGIYDFCEDNLRVNPFRKFLGLNYQSLAGVEVEARLSSRPAYRFRGWFFNDEDYLTGWRQPAGKRPVDYLFYSHIMNSMTVDELAETLLRNRLNLMIPSSFLDINVPEDAENVRRIAERGLYISQHHIEPLGVSRFAFEFYFQKKGVEPQTLSYANSPEAYDEIWRYYVKKWASYPNVIWQLGLRGKVDRPIWMDDATIKNDKEAAGQVISAAIAHQARIIREETGQDNPLMTMTLWEEGAELYRKGYLTIPSGVIIVFTNWPRTQLMRSDFYQIERREGGQYGFYHHTGSFSAGPHAVQGQKLELMKEVFRTTYEKGDRELVISNVQNLREVVFGANAMAKFAYHGPNISTDELIQTWCGDILPDKRQKLEKWYRRFYDTYSVNRWDPETLEGTTYWFDGFVRLAGLLAIDRYRKNSWESEFFKGKAESIEKELQECTEKWECFQEEMQLFCDDLSGTEGAFVRDNLLVQSQIMCVLCRWAWKVYVAIAMDQKGEREKAVQVCLQAVETLEKIWPVLSVAMHDKFCNWYGLEDKFDYCRMLEITKDFVLFLQEDPVRRSYWEYRPNTARDYILNYKYFLG